MSEHTPGPWFAPERTHGTIYVEARLRGTLLQEVAACGPTEHHSQQAANARLIAAAPELLAALRDLEAMAERYRPPGYPVPEAQKKARAVIAKATGAAL